MTGRAARATVDPEKRQDRLAKNHGVEVLCTKTSKLPRFDAQVRLVAILAALTALVPRVFMIITCMIVIVVALARFGDDTTCRENRERQQ